MFGGKPQVLITVGLLWREKSPLLVAKVRTEAESRYSGSSSKWLLFLPFLKTKFVLDLGS